MFADIGILFVIISVFPHIDACGKYEDARCNVLCGPHVCNISPERQKFCWDICGPGIQNGAGRPFSGGIASKPACIPPKRAVRRSDGTYFCQRQTRLGGRTDFVDCRPPFKKAWRSDGSYYCQRQTKLGGGPQKPNCKPPKRPLLGMDGTYTCKVPGGPGCIPRGGSRAHCWE